MKSAIVIAKEAPANDPVLFRGNLAQSVRRAASHGFHAVEIHARDAAELADPTLLGALQETGLSVAALATGMAKRIDGLCFLSADAAVRERAVERVRGFVDCASEFGAGVIVGSLRGTIADKSRRAVEDGWFFACLARVLERAQVRGVTVLVEVINRYENNYLNTVEEALAFLTPLASPCLRLNLDTFHMNIEEADMSGAIRLCGDMMGHLHLADNTRRAPGAGALDFAAIMAAAQESGYRGYASLECLPLPDPDAAARQAMEHIAALHPSYRRGA